MAKITKIDVFSCAKVFGMIYAIIGLIAGIIISLFSFIGSFAGMNFFAALGIFAIILMPIFYGILGFVAGVVMAFLYNLAAKWIGGIEIETKK